MMANDTEEQGSEPRGFGEHSRGLSGEYAHEQGWQLNEDERRKQPAETANLNGGTDYEYGAQDFGENPVNTASVTDQMVEEARQALTRKD